jgi:hypothetical protein
MEQLRSAGMSKKELKAMEKVGKAGNDGMIVE